MLNHLSFLGTVVVAAVAHWVMSSGHSWHLLVHHLTSIYKWLEFIILTLHHLSHGLVEEVLGLVSSGWLVRQRAVTRRHSGVVRHLPWERHVASPRSNHIWWIAVVNIHSVRSDHIGRSVRRCKSALIRLWLRRLVMLRHVTLLVWVLVTFFVELGLLVVMLVGVLDVDVLSYVLVELIELADFWSQHWSNVLLFSFKVIIIDGVVVVVEVVLPMRWALLEAHFVVKSKLGDLLEACVSVLEGMLLIFKHWQVFLVLQESFLERVCLLLGVLSVKFPNSLFWFVEIGVLSLALWVLLAGEKLLNLVIKMVLAFTFFWFLGTLL